MGWKDRVRQSTLPLVVMVLICLSGCRTGPESPSVATGVAAGTTIDPTRAYLPLDRITPRPQRPAKAEPSPLPPRAARQIPKARKLIDQQRYTEAAIELERALRFAPNHPTIQRTLALLHWDAGNLERARAHADRALKVNGDDATAHYVRARCDAKHGDHVAAIADYRTALLCSDLREKPQIAALCRYYLAQSLRAEGYLTAALSQYAAFEQVDARLAEPITHTDLMTLRADRRGLAEAQASILESLGRYSDAADALAPVAGEKQTDAALRLRHARLLMLAKRYDDALSAARAISEDQRAVIDLLFAIHERQGHPERVIGDVRARLATHPEDPQLVLHLGRMLSRLGKREEARRELDRYLSAHAEADDVRLALIEALVEARAWDELIRVGAGGIGRNRDLTERITVEFTELATDSEATRLVLASPRTAPPAADAYLRGVLAAKSEKTEDALKWLGESLDKQPGFLPARVALARLYFDKLRYDDAIKVASRADPEKPEDAALELILGEVYDRLDDPQQAELHLKAAVHQDRANARAMLALAELYRRNGQPLRAQRQLQVLLERFPDHEAAGELLAYAYFREGKRDVAVAKFEALRDRAKTPITKARVAALLDHVFTREPDVAGYRAALKDAMKQYGADAATWLSLAESYDIEREPEPRAEALKNALALDPSNEEAALGLVDTATRLLDFEGALARMTKLTAVRPNRDAWVLGSRSIRFGLVDLYWIVQDYDGAMALIENRLTRPGLEERQRRRYRLELLETLRLMDRKDDAIERLTSWAGEGADDDFYRRLLAEEYVRQEQFDKVIPILEASQKEDPDNQRALSLLLASLMGAEQTDRATQYVLDWLSNDPENDEAIDTLARVLANADRVDDAVELLSNRLLRTLDRQRLQNTTFRVLLSAKRYDQCLELVERLLDEVTALLRSVQDFHAQMPPVPPASRPTMHLPNEPFTAEQLHQRLATLRGFQSMALVLDKQYREAENLLTGWLENARDPNERAGFLLRLADCYRSEGKSDKAGEAIERALALRPDQIGLNNDVAYGWIDKGVRLDEAERMIRYAVSRRPRTSAYLDTYGWLLYKKGKLADAEKWLRRARGTPRGNDPVIHDHLGDVAWRLHQKQEAIEHWRAAVTTVAERQDGRLNPDEKRVRNETSKKIDAAEAGNEPAVAPLGEGVEPGRPPGD